MVPCSGEVGDFEIYSVLVGTAWLQARIKRLRGRSDCSAGPVARFCVRKHRASIQLCQCHAVAKFMYCSAISWDIPAPPPSPTFRGPAAPLPTGCIRGPPPIPPHILHCRWFRRPPGPRGQSREPRAPSRQLARSRRCLMRRPGPTSACSDCRRRRRLRRCGRPGTVAPPPTPPDADVERRSVQVGTAPLASASCACKLNQASRQILRRSSELEIAIAMPPRSRPGAR